MRVARCFVFFESEIKTRGREVGGTGGDPGAVVEGLDLGKDDG